MSGPIRRVIGPAKKRLDGYITETRTHMNTKPNMAVREEVTLWLRNLRNDLLRIQDTIKSIEDQNNRWSKILEKLEDNKLATETELYDNTAGGENGFINSMELGREATYALISTINEAERTVSVPSLTQLVSNTNLNQNVGNPVVTTGGGGQISTLPGVSSSLQISFPKTKMREFSGEQKKWSAFWSLYSKTVDNQPVPDVQKFNYLLLCLKGEALALVEDYDPTDENYKLAIEDLKERYGDTEQIKASLHADLRNLKPAAPGIQSIRSLVDSIEKTCKQLEQQGEDLNNSSIAGIIKAKLPQWIKVELIKAEKLYCQPDKEGIVKPWNTKAIRIHLKDIVNTYVKANKSDQQPEVSTTNPKHGGKPNRKEDNNKEGRSEARVFVMKSTQQSMKTQNNRRQITQRSQPQFRSQVRSQKYPKKCLFCSSEDHYSTFCTKFSSGEARQKRLNSLKKCILCLFEGHGVSECPKRNFWKCNICRGQHRMIVCPRAVNNPEVFQSPATTPKPTITAMIINHALEGPLDKKEPVFLMTREVLAFKKEGTKGGWKNTEGVESNLFFDLGATKSFVEEELADDLKLVSEGEEHLNAYGFGTRPPEMILSKKVKIAVGNPEKKKAYQFTFNTTPEIISEKCRELRD